MPTPAVLARRTAGSCSPRCQAMARCIGSNSGSRGPTRASRCASAARSRPRSALRSTRLARLDAASRHGPWTAAALDLIAERPGTRAPDLAASLGRETARFKADVRKLKELGLTESLEVGYRLSPRGRAYCGYSGVARKRSRRSSKAGLRTPS
ncbi:MAG TPA: hypothetical protein VFY47_01300 [Thermoleophilaceae bacterium]|nr:hypothetical protein [Thermoleophilaceae bacterium]